jgi:hypothetical protein
MKRKVINFALFQAGWFTCVLAAAADRAWLGPLAVLLVLAIHLTLIERSWAELAFLMVAGALGTVLDSLQVWLGAVRFAGPRTLNVLCPLWITALWFGFSTTLNVSLGWLRQRYVLAAILGAVAGPLTYLGAARLGALEIPSTLFAVATVGLEYAVILPLLLLVSGMIRRSGEPRDETDPQTGVLCEPEA